MFRNRKFQAYTGLVLGLLSWVLPGGIVLSLAAILFGLRGLYLNINDNSSYIVVAIISILLGISSRLLFAFYTQTGQTGALTITFFSMMAIVWIFLKRKTR